MSQKTLNRLVVGLGAVIVLWAATALLTRTGDGTVVDGGVTAWLEAVDTAGVRAVAFSGGTGELGTVRLTRTEGGWTVDGHPADSLQITRLLEALDEASAGAPVASNPTNHARMEVDEASARSLVLEWQDHADTLLLGKVGTSYSSIYARLPGSDEVYQIDADFLPHRNREPSGWRSRRITAVDTASVTGIEVSVDGTAVLLQRGDTSWTVEGSAAEPQAVRDLLSELRALEATAFPPADSADTATNGAPSRLVTAFGDGDTELVVIRLWGAEPEANANLTARAEGPGARQAGVAFTVPSWRADRLAPSTARLSGSAPAP